MRFYARITLPWEHYAIASYALAPLTLKTVTAETELPGLRYPVLKVSKHGKLYRLATVSEIPTEPKDFHRLMQQVVVQHHGWGTYVLTRPQYFNEARGFKLVCVFRITAEGITLLKTDTSRPVFPDLPGKKMYWEREPKIPRGVPVPRAYVPSGLRAVLIASGAVRRTSKLKTRHQHGRPRLFDALRKGI